MNLGYLFLFQHKEYFAQLKQFVLQYELMIDKLIIKVRYSVILILLCKPKASFTRNGEFVVDGV